MIPEFGENLMYVHKSIIKCKGFEIGMAKSFNGEACKSLKDGILPIVFAQTGDFANSILKHRKGNNAKYINCDSLMPTLSNIEKFFSDADYVKRFAPKRASDEIGAATFSNSMENTGMPSSSTKLITVDVN